MPQHCTARWPCRGGQDLNTVVAARCHGIKRRENAKPKARDVERQVDTYNATRRSVISAGMHLFCNDGGVALLRGRVELCDRLRLPLRLGLHDPVAYRRLEPVNTPHLVSLVRVAATGWDDKTFDVGSPPW